jgi:UPF0251 protein dhaf_1981
MPQSSVFIPEDAAAGEPVVLTVDEYETIRLIDLEGCTQKEAAEQMHVARTTVQRVYNEARRKTADALVNSKKLAIAGGDYILCGQFHKRCGRGCKKSCHGNMRGCGKE